MRRRLDPALALALVIGFAAIAIGVVGSQLPPEPCIPHELHPHIRLACPHE